MKTNLLASLIFLYTATACSDKFFEALPPGQATADQFNNRAGVEKLLIGAYALIDGTGASSDGTLGPTRSATVSNWIYGDVSSDDSYFSGYTGGFAYERHAIFPTDTRFNNRWLALYDGVNRTNKVLQAITKATDIDEANRKRLTGEARFLRGYYYFDLRKIFNRVPYVDENTPDTRVPNDKEIWPNIEADLKFAAENLPGVQNEVGRANVWAAKSLLAKAYVFQSKWTEAKTVLDDVIANGKTSNGLKYGLNDCFRDAFDIATKNSKESVFAVQRSVNDGTPGNGNGNYGQEQSYPVFADAGTCCGDNKPSQNLVNAYKTDDSGLPMLDTYNNSDLKNDDAYSSRDPYTPDTQTPIDPRLDWTASRRGLPFLDWGLTPGVEEWTGGGGHFGGPYFALKLMFRKSEVATQTGASTGNAGVSAMNYTAIRFADVLLWAAECEVEVGSLEKAREYVNQVRRRAKNGCYVMGIDDKGNSTGKPAANYQVSEYKTAWTDKAVARKAVRFERRLELAIEGHRFFDLVRWGVAAETINAYIAVEGKKRPPLASGAFVKGKHEYFPIPQTQIINSSVNGKPTLTQNPGY